MTRTRDTFNKIVPHETKVTDAVQSGDIKITGDRAKLENLVSDLDISNSGSTS